MQSFPDLISEYLNMFKLTMKKGLWNIGLQITGQKSMKSELHEIGK